MRVLIVRIGAMGDVLHAMPAVAALRELHQDWEIHWAIEPRWSELLAAGSVGAGVDARMSNPTSGMMPPDMGHPELVLPRTMPLVDGWFRVPTREWKRHTFSVATVASVRGLRRELRADKFDLVVDMQGSIRSAGVGRMTGAKRFVGFAEPRERPAGLLYGERVKVAAAHVVEQGCELLGAAVGEILQPARVTLPIDVAAENWCDGLGLGRFVLIAPSAGWGAKEWPAERYGAVAAALIKAGYAVLVNAASSGDVVAENVVGASEGLARAVPCSVGQMIALVRRAALVIGGDTGPVHLAAALERPVVGIYGPTDPARNGPYGVGVNFAGRVLRDASSVTSYSHVGGVEGGLLRIGVDEVVGAALEVLGA